MKKVIMIIFLISINIIAAESINKDAISFYKNTSSKKDIVIITDPECPHCRNLAKDKKDKFKNYNIKYILVALPYHKNAKQMISYILEGKDNTEKYHRYKEIMIGEDISYKEKKTNKKKVEKYLKDAMKEVKIFGIRKVPSIFDVEEEYIFQTTYEEL